MSLVSPFRDFLAVVILSAIAVLTPIARAQVATYPADPSSVLAVQLAKAAGTPSIGEAKLAFDAVIDPTFDAKAVRSQVRRLADEVVKLAGKDAPDNDKMIAMRTVLYEAGPWNGHRPFGYDHNDPQGKNTRHKTIAYYLETRQGNCVTMPMLILMVGGELGLDMTLTAAPRHMMVKFTPRETGVTQNIEGTSGGYSQTLAWMRSQLPMTDRSIESGMFMANLNIRQSIALAAEILLQDLETRGVQEERIEVADKMLSAFPQDANALLHHASAYDALVQKNFVGIYPTLEKIPADKLPEFDRMALEIDLSVERLLSYGWQRASATE